MHFEFATAARILFGAGKLREAAPVAKTLGRRVLLVTGRDAGRARPFLDTLTAEGLDVCAFSVDCEPTFELVRRGLSLARQERSDLVIGFGGGSVLDCAKAIAMLLANGGDPLDYAEVIGSSRPIVHPSIPLIAIPTTAGTGSEVTRNAVLESPEHGVKVSLRSAHMLPRFALVDPELTLGLPPALTACTGMDALAQLVEPFVSVRANPMTDAICREGLRRAGRSLRRAYETGNDIGARSDMALASLFSGMALANAGLGAVHGFAAPLGGMFHAPHGAVCACLLAEVMETNARILREKKDERWQRFMEIAQRLTGRPEAGVDDGIAWVRETAALLRIPPLRSYGITPSDFDALIEKAAASSSMKGNPIALSAADLRGILERSL